MLWTRKCNTEVYQLAPQKLPGPERKGSSSNHKFSGVNSLFNSVGVICMFMVSMFVVMYVNLVGASVLPLLPGPAPGSQVKDLSSHLKKLCFSTSKKYVFVKCSMCQVLFMICWKCGCKVSVRYSLRASIVLGAYSNASSSGFHGGYFLGPFRENRWGIFLQCEPRFRETPKFISIIFTSWPAKSTWQMYPRIRTCFREWRLCHFFHLECCNLKDRYIISSQSLFQREDVGTVVAPTACFLIIPPCPRKKLKAKTWHDIWI